MYDVIVVGGGIMGSSATYHLAKRKRKVLLLEQFYLPHSRGSSHGQSRIIRNVYRQDFLTKMASESLRMWRILETESGGGNDNKNKHNPHHNHNNNHNNNERGNIFVDCGCLLFADGRDPRKSFVDDAEANLIKHKIPFEKLDARGLRNKFPQINFRDEDVGVFDSGAGTLHADVALKTFQRVALDHGAEIRDGEGVDAILEAKSGRGVVVKTPKGEYRAAKLILTPGPWAATMLKQVGVSLPLQTLRIQVCYWKEREKGLHSISRFPAFIDAAGSSPSAGYSDIYGLPADEYPGHVKICLHYGVEAEPEMRDAVNNEGDVQIVSDFVKERFPRLDSSAPSITETCMYTLTPDWNFVIDRANPVVKEEEEDDGPIRIEGGEDGGDGGGGDVVYAVGFSGQGFKMAPAVGEMLADVAEEKRTKFDLKNFSPKRFL